MNRGVALFFVFIFFVAGICLLGVVHAILLDEFMVAVQEERHKLKEEEVELKFITAEKLGSPLDPLLASLAHFHSSADLSQKIRELFLMIDANGSGSLDYQEICDGLQAPAPRHLFEERPRRRRGPAALICSVAACRRWRASR